MTLLERLRALYDKPLDNFEVCNYCGRRIGNHEEHDELCVWKVTQEAIAALGQEIAERKLLAQWVRDHFPNPLDHNAECLFCDEQFGEHTPPCPWCEAP